MSGNSMRENREALPASDKRYRADRLEKVMSHNSSMNADRESDGREVPAKYPNKDGSNSSAEGAEGRRPTKENTGQTTASQMQSWENALNGLHRVREAAKGTSGYDSPRYCTTYRSRFYQTASTPSSGQLLR